MSEALDARVERETHKLTCWQVEMNSMSGNQREVVEARVREQQVLECALNSQQETTRQFLYKVMQGAEEHVMVRRAASPRLAHAQGEVWEMAQQA